jgi:predicted DNA-binding protein (MmcQ/YjbR family)
MSQAAPILVTMTPDELRELCLTLPQAIETFPFGEETSVFKTSGNDKLFAVCALDAEPLSATLKCDPEESLALQEEFSQITPGYHMNKKHWITVVLDSVIPDDLVEQLVRGSHALVRPRVPRSR